MSLTKSIGQLAPASRTEAFDRLYNALRGLEGWQKAKILAALGTIVDCLPEPDQLGRFKNLCTAAIFLGSSLQAEVLVGLASVIGNPPTLEALATPSPSWLAERKMRFDILQAAANRVDLRYRHGLLIKLAEAIGKLPQACRRPHSAHEPSQ
ncbi:hypothetical protein [Ralstonia psammae]|uniref:hypothetical protein n=1 Tax=Ralstonia psammae TaxID=3058598 RepID=UPI00292DD627|nr:hypothetical protein [Ralstonia sp. LMG 19083]